MWDGDERDADVVSKSTFTLSEKKKGGVGGENKQEYIHKSPGQGTTQGQNRSCQQDKADFAAGVWSCHPVKSWQTHSYTANVCTASGFVSKLIRTERDNSAKPKPWMAKGFQSPLWAPSEPYRTW